MWPADIGISVGASLIGASNISYRLLENEFDLNFAQVGMITLTFQLTASLPSVAQIGCGSSVYVPPEQLQPTDA